MNIKTQISNLTFAGIAIAFLSTAQAQYEGDYALFGCDLSFRDDTLYSSGKTKEISSSFANISLSSSNTFSGFFGEDSIHRTVNDARTNINDQIMYRNFYESGLTQYPSDGPVTGTADPSNAFGKLMITDDEDSFPLYFSANSNVAFNMYPLDDSSDNFDSIELGILVRKGSGLDNSSLSGNYLRFSYGNGISGEAAPGFGTGTDDTLALEKSLITFNGDGSYSESYTEWEATRTIHDVITNIIDHASLTTGSLTVDAGTERQNSGQYQLEANGSLTIDPSDEPIPCQLSPDAQLAVSSLAYDDGQFLGTYFSIIVKVPDNFSTDFVDTTYFIAEFEEEFQRDSEMAGINNNYAGVNRTYVHLKLDGSFSMRTDAWGLENTFINEFRMDGGTNDVYLNNIHTEPNAKVIELSSGTYAVNSKGEITLNFSNGETGQAQISENKEYLVFGHSEGSSEYANCVIGVGIRRNAPEDASEPVEFTETSMTSTGLYVNATLPMNHEIELLYSEDLSEGEWSGVGILPDTHAGSYKFTDPELTNSAFYNATFGPW